MKLIEALIGLIVLCIILGFPTMWLWNWLMPKIFILPKIDFWEALGVNLLCGILFKDNSIKD